MAKFKQGDIISDGIISATVLSVDEPSYKIKISTLGTLDDFLGGTISVPQTTIDATCGLVGVMDI